MTGCVTIATQSPKSLTTASTNEVSTLNSWWSLFNDETLDKLVSSAISLNFNNKHSKNAVALEIVRKYSQYHYVQSQKNLITQYIINQDSLSDSITPEIKSQQIALLKKKIGLENQAIDISIEITKLTKLLPEYVAQILKKSKGLPSSNITPILASDASIIFNSPQITAASTLFVRNIGSGITIDDAKNIFPNMSFGQFFGISDNVYLNNNSSWSVSIGSSIQNLRLAKFEPQYTDNDIYKKFIDEIYTKLVNIEHKIISYASMQEQHIALENAAKEYNKECSKDPSICENAYSAALASLRAEYERINILSDLYEML